MTRPSPKRRHQQAAPEPQEAQQEPQFATEEDIKRLAEAAKFWDNPEVKRLLAEREQQEKADREKGK